MGHGLGCGLGHGHALDFKLAMPLALAIALLPIGDCLLHIAFGLWPMPFWLADCIIIYCKVPTALFIAYCL